jgi:hypothetical protein
MSGQPIHCQADDQQNEDSGEADKHQSPNSFRADHQGRPFAAPPTIRHHNRFDHGAKLQTGTTEWSTSFANYNPASG